MQVRGPTFDSPQRWCQTTSGSALTSTRPPTCVIQNDLWATHGSEHRSAERRQRQVALSDVPLSHAGAGSLYLPAALLHNHLQCCGLNVLRRRPAICNGSRPPHSTSPGAAAVHQCAPSRRCCLAGWLADAQLSTYRSRSCDFWRSLRAPDVTHQCGQCN